MPLSKLGSIFQNKRTKNHKNGVLDRKKMVEEEVDVCVHLSPRIHQEYTSRHRSACRTPAESGQEYLTSRKEYIEPRKTREDEGTRGKERSVSRTGPALSRWGN